MRPILLYFLRLGALGFGGPIALAGRMERDLVEDRKWITKDEYLEGLALAQLSPGPLAAQLAMYLGWVRGGALGAAGVGIAFVLPSFLMVMVFAYAYVRLGKLEWVQGVFYGVGAAVIALIVQSVVKLTKTALGKDWLLWALFLGNAAVTAWTQSEFVWLFVVSGIVAVAARWRGEALLMLPAMLVTGAHGPASNATVLRVLWFFTKAGAFVFGSGLAIVPFLYDGVVVQYQWLDADQFRDAVAVAMVTPGPVVITAGFIGYMAAGVLGAFAAAAGTFVPPYLVVVLLARPLKRARDNAKLRSFIGGVTAAAVGAIAGAAYILGRKAIIDVPTAAIALVALGFRWKLPKVPEPALIVAAGLVGFLLRK